MKTGTITLTEQEHKTLLGILNFATKSAGLNELNITINCVTLFEKCKNLQIDENNPTEDEN